MLSTLLESKAKQERSTGGAIASVALHTALIGAAVYATAQARIEGTKPTEAIHAVYFAPTRMPTPSNPDRSPIKSILRYPLKFVDPRIPVTIPPIEFTLPDVPSGEFGHGPTVAAHPFAGENPGNAASDSTFSANQVEKEVSVISGGAAPRYPEMLRVAGIEGKVVARFVVNQSGFIEEGSIKFTRSDNHLFEDAVRVALARMRFTPAEIGGMKVRQLVEIPFAFTLSH